MDAAADEVQGLVECGDARELRLVVSRPAVAQTRWGALGGGLVAAVAVVLGTIFALVPVEPSFVFADVGAAAHTHCLRAFWSPSVGGDGNAEKQVWHYQAQLSLVLLLVVLLLLAFTVSVVYGLYHFLGSMTSALESIQDTLSPATLRRAVSSVQGSLDNVYNTTGNVFNVSESAEVLADKMIETINNTATLMAHANAMGQQLLAHPTVTLALGGGSANGEL